MGGYGQPRAMDNITIWTRPLRVKTRNARCEPMSSALHPESGLKSDIGPCPKTAISGSRTHSILVATGEHLAAIVIRAARLAAILLRIARGLRHADKGPASYGLTGGQIKG